MDGLTKFIELIIQRTKSPSTKIPWETLENAYVQSKAPTSVGGGGGIGGGGGQKTNESDYFTKWEEMNLGQYAGLFSALASMSTLEQQQQLGINFELQHIWDLKNFYTMTGLHRIFPLWKKGITKEIVEKEINFLMSSYPTNTSYFELIQNRIEDLLLEGNSFDRDFEKLSSVLYVVQELEQCNIKNAHTLKTMTNDEEVSFRNCVEQKIKSKGNIDKTVSGFAEYKFRHIPKKDIQAVAEYELKAREKAETLTALKEHTILRSEIIAQQFSDFLIASPYFWSERVKPELEFAIAQYVNKQRLTSSPGILLLIHDVMEAQNPDDSTKLMQIALKNYFYLFETKIIDIPINTLVQALRDFEPELDRKLDASRMSQEIETFLKFTLLTSDEKAKLQQLKDSQTVEIAKKFNYLASSKFIIFKNQPQSFAIKQRIQSEQPSKLTKENFVEKLQFYNYIYDLRINYTEDPKSFMTEKNVTAEITFKQKKFKALKIILNQLETADEGERDVITSRYETVLGEVYNSSSDNAVIEKLIKNTETLKKYDDMFQLSNGKIQDIIDKVYILQTALIDFDCDTLYEIVIKIQNIIRDSAVPADWKDSIIECAKGFFKTFIIDQNCPDHKITEVDKFLREQQNIPKISLSAKKVTLKAPKTPQTVPIPPIYIPDDKSLTSKIQSLRKFTRKLEILYNSSDMYQKEKAKFTMDETKNAILMLARRVYFEALLTVDGKFEGDKLEDRYNQFLVLDAQKASDCIKNKTSSPECTFVLQQFALLAKKFLEPGDTKATIPIFNLGKLAIGNVKMQINKVQLESSAIALMIDLLNVVENAKMLPGQKELNETIANFYLDLQEICHVVAKKYEDEDKQLAIRLYNNAKDLTSNT